ncbi:MAG TPA: sugar phosphate nucleotidyltransferase [Candidatus Nanoarchaeia archaeon]|nr:sugar phosphate nucleotidyltransferase [Candidatus Nanoarchaeia archaeon]
MSKSKISITINEKILGEIDSIIDNVYIRNRSQAIEHLVKNSLGENKAAVMLLGGDAEHLRISKEDYRPTAKMKDKSVIELALKKFRENNFKTIFIVARHEILTKIFEMVKDGTDYGVKVTYIEEKSSRGTADSLRHIKGKISTSFLVVYGDVIFDKINIEELWNDHIKQNSIATIMLTTSSKPSEKGTVKVEGNKVLAFTQKSKKSDIYLVFSPIFVAETQMLEYSGSSLEMDIFPELAQKGMLNGHLSSEKEVHIHSLSDLKNYQKN